MHPKVFAYGAIPSLVLCLSVYVNGQGLINNGASIRITDSATLFVEGNITSQQGSRIQNEGNLVLTGDWMNNADSKIFRKEKGMVTFMKDFHFIGGDSMTLFYHVTFTDTGITRLTRDITIQGKLLLNDHRIFLDGHRLHLAGSSRGAFQYHNGQIIAENPMGSFFSWNSGSEAGLRTVPFGTEDGENIPLIYETNADSGTVLNFSTYKTNAAFEPLPSGRNKIHALAGHSSTGPVSGVVKRFWLVESSDSTVMGHFRFAYSNKEGDTSLYEHQSVYSWNDSSQAWSKMPFYQTREKLPSCLAPAGKTIFSIGVSGPEIIHSSLTFTAFPFEGSFILTRWFVTNPEADRYVVEKSRDGKQFEKLGELTSFQFRKTPHHFELKDPSPYSGYSWYRLQPFYKDSALGISEPAKVFIDPAEEVKVNFYPNPVHQSAILQVHAGSVSPGEITFELVDGTGKLAFRKKLSEMNPQDNHLYEFNRENLLAGFYGFRVFTNEKNLKTGKIIIE